MQITVTGRHMEISDSVRDYTHGRVEHELKEFPRIESVHVILDVQKYRHIAEVVLQAARHVRVEAKEESDDMYVSIDRAVEKAAKQIHKLRDRLVDHKGRANMADVEAAVGEKGP